MYCGDVGCGVLEWTILILLGHDPIAYFFVGRKQLCPNYNDDIVKAMAWMSNFTPHSVDVISSRL